MYKRVLLINLFCGRITVVCGFDYSAAGRLGFESELSYDCEESEVGRGSRVRAGWYFWSYLARKTPMVRVKR